MNTTSQYEPRNAGPLCAEMHGGNCPDPDTCVYRVTIFDAADPLAEAELRGYLRALRMTAGEYRRGFTLGFWIGILAFFAALMLFALLQWAVAA